MKKILLVVVIALGCPVESSAGGLIYAGGNTGYASLGSSDNLAYGMHAGVGIIPFVGIEAGYWNFGSFDDVDYTTLYLSAKPNITLGPVNLFARGGLSWYDKDSSGGGSDEGVDLMYGFGAEYFIGRNISLGASYTNFGFSGDRGDALTFSATFHLL